MLENILILSGAVALFALYYGTPILFQHLRSRFNAMQEDPPEPEPDRLDYPAAMAAVDQIQEIRERLDKLKELITYLEITPPESQQVTCSTTFQTARLYIRPHRQQHSGSPGNPDRSKGGTCSPPADPLFPLAAAARNSGTAWTKRTTKQRPNADQTDPYFPWGSGRKGGLNMQEVKYCQRCGVVIGDAYNTDWYAYISQKYCKACKKICDRERKAEWARNKRRKVALAKAEAAAEQTAEERERLQLRRAESRELTLQRQKNKVMEQEIAALQAYIVKLRELT